MQLLSEGTKHDVDIDNNNNEIEKMFVKYIYDKSDFKSPCYITSNNNSKT